MSRVKEFVFACAKEALRGSRAYYLWCGALMAVALLGFAAYLRQVTTGLIVTGLSDQVTWGIYIANFTFLIGMAAAAVMLVIPSYIFHRTDAKTVVLLAEGMAVAACTIALCFVIVDLGRPDRFWHMIPFLGRLNWPRSMLAWDTLVVSGYLALNLLVPAYVLFKKWNGEQANMRRLLPFIILSILWAVSLHTVTAFLFSANSARPFWHTALLGPRFLASAFVSGPAAMILAFALISKRTDFKITPAVPKLLSVIVGAALQINLIMLAAEIFNEFYSPTTHSASAQYLFLGLHGNNALLPWIYTALSIELVALMVFLVEKWRTNQRLLLGACGLSVIGVWIEKGMGLIIPGFVPTPLGEIFEYSPSLNETVVALGIWALGLLIFTVLAKVSIPIELGRLRHAESTPQPTQSTSAQVAH